MAEIVNAWQCIGCGKIDAPQQCVGVCQDRKIELVYAEQYRAATTRMHELEDLVRQIALTTPRSDGWERTYRALQLRARLLLSVAAVQTAGAASADITPNSK